MKFQFKDPVKEIAYFQQYWNEFSQKIIASFERSDNQFYKEILGHINDDFNFSIYDYLENLPCELRNVELALNHLLDYFWIRIELSNEAYLLDKYQENYFNWNHLKHKLEVYSKDQLNNKISFGFSKRSQSQEFKALACKFEDSLCRLASKEIYISGIDFIIAFNRQISFLTGEFSFLTPGIQAEWEYLQELIAFSQMDGLFGLEDIEIPVNFEYLKKPLQFIVEGISPKDLDLILVERFSSLLENLNIEKKLFKIGLIDIQKNVNPYLLKSKLASILGIPDSELEIKDSGPMMDDLLLESPHINKTMELKELAEHFLFWADRARKEGLSTLEYYLQSVSFSEDIDVLFNALLNGISSEEISDYIELIFLVRENQKKMELEFWRLGLLLLQHPQSKIILREMNFFIQEMSLACRKNSKIKFDQFSQKDKKIRLMELKLENTSADMNIYHELIINKNDKLKNEKLFDSEVLKKLKAWQIENNKQKIELYRDLENKKKDLIKIQSQKNPALETIEYLLTDANSIDFTRELLTLYLKKEKRKGQFLRDLSRESKAEIDNITNLYLGKSLQLDGRDTEVTILRQMIQKGLLNINVISELPHEERLHFIREFFYLQGIKEEDPFELKKEVQPCDFSFLALALKDSNNGTQKRIFEVLNDEEIRLIKSSMEYI